MWYTVWYDNRPCDRFEPGFRRLILFALAAAFIPMAVVLFFIDLALTRSVPVAAAIALAIGLGLPAAAIAAFSSVEGQMPVELSFGLQDLTWRSRKGATLRCHYGAVIEIVASPWKGDWSGGECQRYVVHLRRGDVRVPRIWLRSDNKDRLEAAIRDFRGSASLR